MIVREGSGYSVKSESGKHLGGPYPSRGEAEKRLAQVEMFKSMRASGDLKSKVLSKKSNL